MAGAPVELLSSNLGRLQSAHEKISAAGVSASEGSPLVPLRSTCATSFWWALMAGRVLTGVGRGGVHSRPRRLVRTPGSYWLAGRGSTGAALRVEHLLQNERLVTVTLPGFDVHQDFDNVLMNGERDGQRNGTES